MKHPRLVFAFLLVLAVILAGVTIYADRAEAKEPVEPVVFEATQEPHNFGSEIEMETETADDVVLMDKTMYVCGDHVNERAEMNTNCQIVRQLLAGEAVTVVGQIGDWYMLGNGDYVSADYLVETYDEAIARMHENHRDLIVCSISRQEVQYWYYGQMIASGKCVTGDAVKSPTPLGLYWITSRQTDVDLMGDDGLHADYFCTFNGQIGFHDAVWNPTDFGGSYYLTAGSHGCVRCEYNLAQAIFENCVVNQTAVLVMP
ncbi:L,D-transpeptidase family protein [Candidatus Saccharibacteria bacterium]|nr:L,D-transpeptidase family protein [Candidatus Saccharibacteria bacterium]MBR6961220.1 L,D-transpeptidase family protein [Candidatus Saccharibacteria bacterium]